MNKEIERLKMLSLKKLKEKARDIKSNLPQDEKKVISYSKNFTLALSNYCENQCGYCFFNYKVPKLSGEGNVILLDNTQMVRIIQKALQFNCKEALIMSGEHPDSFKEVKDEMEAMGCSDYIEFVKDICNYLLDLNILPHTNIGLLSYEEMINLKNYNASMGLMLESTSMELFKQGGVHEFSPGKLPEKRIEHIKHAGELKIPFTTGLLLGIGENFDDRIKDLYLIKEIHEEYGHIQEVIIQNFVYKDGITYRPDKKLLIEEMLKLTGIARLIFGNEIAIQVPPNLIAGYEKDFISMGIDDFGGISPFALDYINPQNEWPQLDHLQSICIEEGFILKERLPIYDKFITQREFCPENIKKVINNII